MSKTSSEEQQSHAPLIEITLYQCGNCNFSTSRRIVFERGTKITSDFLGTYPIPALVCPVCKMPLDDGR